VAGADEAGRGPLAGPVVAAAVILPACFDLRGIGDSKKLSPAAREAAFARILAEAIVEIEFADVAEIDARNILHASEAAMARAINRLNSPKVYVDGHRIPPGLNIPAQAIVKGDGKIVCIAAASIVAKVTRDRFMGQLATEFPAYGFDQHFGYPTPEHLAALAAHGPCPHHRRSFAPVRAWFEPPTLDL
jgi:ribonuclease HII